MKITTLLIYLSALILIGCNKFEFSPYQTEVEKDMPTDLNNININKIKLTETIDDDTVTIIFTGDSQNFYDRLSDLVAKVNTLPNVDFLILCGDIADYGILQEYLWINERLKKLKTPYLGVIGNHDLAANNGEIFAKMFGNKNFSMEYKGYKFLFHDSNSREYNFNGCVPNIYWLTDQLNDTVTNWFVGISHVPPYDIDFEKSLEYPYKNLFSSKANFILSLHGHLHGIMDSYQYNDHVRYMTCNAVSKDEFVLLKLINGVVIKEMVAY